MTLGDRLNGLRLMAGISCRELARIAGISEGYPALIESGVRLSIGSDIAMRLAKTLGTTIDYLVAGDGDPPAVEDVQAAVDRARSAEAGAA